MSSFMKSLQKLMTRGSRKKELAPVQKNENKTLRLKLLGQILQS